MEITLEVEEDNLQFFMELIKKFDFVKIKESSFKSDLISPYDTDFVEKIKRSEKQVSEGNFKQINPVELWD